MSETMLCVCAYNAVTFIILVRLYELINLYTLYRYLERFKNDEGFTQ